MSCDETPSAAAYAGFCTRYPAFLDESLALMRRPARELNEMVSGSVWLRLGQGMASCLEHLSGVLRRGTESGAFEVDDPDVFWTSTLGMMHLARLGIGVSSSRPISAQVSTTRSGVTRKTPGTPRGR